MIEQNTRNGIMLMIATTFIFSVQDGISRHLAGEYNVLMVVMVRYWFFAAFVLGMAQFQFGGLRQVARTDRPFLHIARGLLLIAEICIMVAAFVFLGLVETHAVFACTPLIVAALSGPILGEWIGWRRWAAIGVGFLGILVILQPGASVFSFYSLIPLISAAGFALYILLSRLAMRTDSAATSFFWTGIVGAVGMTVVGIWYWEPMTPTDWLWMVGLGIAGIAGQYTMIRCYAVVDAGTVQPLTYLQLLFITVIGLTFFGETLTLTTITGGLLVISAGLFTIFRERSAA